MGAIDLDRGVTMRQIVKFNDKGGFLPDPAYGGMQVFMYKDEPGVYYNIHGKKLPEAIAKRAGFDTEKHAKMRKFREADQAFKAQLAKELALELGEEVILAENKDYKVVAMPMERAKIIDKDTGNAINSVPMPKADAMVLFEELNGGPANQQPKAKEK